ncbi:MAG: Na+/H+ antiporter NhaC family protein [Rikenellaceae bacterium]
MGKIFKNQTERTPSLIASLIPLAVLTVLLFLVIKAFGSDSISGGSQIALLTATAICGVISIFGFGCSWEKLEAAMTENIRASGTAIVILLLIGAISGSWMLSGVVPTMIYYGLDLLNPKIFLVATCVICALVSLLTGSSWTTVATIGVAFMGIGSALGFSEGWIAGAIISGAYFGDKISVLSDTTVLASSTVGVPIFTHIQYMLYTSFPAFVVAMIVFTVVGFSGVQTDAADVSAYTQTISSTFNISPWLLAVPVLTGVLIAMRLPAIITLFASTFMAAMVMLFVQPEIMSEVVGVTELDGMARFKAVFMSCYGSTSIQTPVEAVTDLISTRGMSGMLSTIWLIICAMCFGGAMAGSGMLETITRLFLRIVNGAASTVASTLCSGFFFNLCTGDQYISIILTGRLFKSLYEKQGLEDRLLSRSVEDSATVTSVLIPWNTCGMTQATVLGVATFTYLPYCIFNIASPIMSLLMALLGINIKRRLMK